MLRYLNPVDHHPARIRKIDELIGNELDFEDIKSSVKTIDIYKIEKRNSIGICVFGFEKNISALRVRKYFKKDVNLLLIEKRKKKNTMFLSTILKHSYMIIL